MRARSLPSSTHMMTCAGSTITATATATLVVVLLLFTTSGFDLGTCMVLAQEQQQDDPSIVVDVEGNLLVRAATNKTLFFNEMDLVSVISQQQQQLRTQISINAELQASITTLNDTLYQLPCRTLNPLPYPSSTFNYNVTTLGQGVRVDYESDHLDVSELAISKWRMGVLASNGLVYGAPYAATAVVLINPATNEIDTTSIAVSNPSGNACYGVVQADNGKLYFLPANADNVLIVDPNNNNAVDQTSITGLGSGTPKWLGGALSPNNNKIYCAPYNSELVLIIDPSDDTADTTTIAGLPTSSAKWTGAVLADNGMIYGIPNFYDFVLIINPTDDSADYTSVPVESGNHKWNDGVLGNNGKIYGMPFNMPKVLVIDPSDSNAISYIDVNLPSSAANWLGGVVTGKGRIVGIPYSATAILIIDTDTDTVDYTSLKAPLSSSKWVGGVHVPQYNRIYGIPRQYHHILQIDVDPCM